MSAGLILEFDGVGRDEYEAVNERLGIDMNDERLGRALQEGGITEPPTRVEWIELANHHTLAG